MIAPRRPCAAKRLPERAFATASALAALIASLAIDTRAASDALPTALPFEAFLAEVQAEGSGAADAAAPGPPPAVLTVGLNGVNWAVLDPLVEAGFLPTLQRLVRSGARARLDCLPAGPVAACIDPPIWASLVTGQPARVHGVGDFDAPPSARGAPAFWTVLGRYGGLAGLAGYPNSWPPQDDLDWVLTEPGIAHAAELLLQPWPAVADPRRDVALHRTRPAGLFEALGMLPRRGPRRPAWRGVALDRVTMEAVLRQELDQLHRNPERRRRPYLVMVHLISTDQAGHFTWHTIQKSPDAPIDRAALLEQAAQWKGPSYLPGPHGFEPVSHRLLEIDRWLQELLARVPYDYVIVHGDHGMTRSRKSGGLPGHHVVRFAPEARYGVFVLSGPGVSAGREIGTLSVLDFAPTLAYLLGLPVAEDLPGRVPREAFSDAHRASHPQGSVPSWSTPSAEPADARAPSGASSAPGRPARAAQQPTLPAVADLQGVVHPAARRLEAGRHLAGDESPERVEAGQLLPQHQLAAAPTAEGGAEAGLHLEQRTALLPLAPHLLGVVRARAQHVLLEPTPVGPDRILHEDRGLVVGRRRGDRAEVELAQGRPGQRQQDLAGHVVAQLVQARGELGEVAAVHAQEELLPGGGVAQRRDADHLVGGAGAMGVVQEVEQPRAVVRRQCWQPGVAHQRLEIVLAAPDHLVKLVQEEHAATLAGSRVSG